MLGVGVWPVVAYADAQPTIASDPLTVTITGTAPPDPNPFDQIVLTSSDLTRETSQNWFCTAQIKKNGVNVPQSGHTIQILRDGVTVFFQVTDATGKAAMTIPALSIGPAGTYSMRAQSSQYPLILSNTLSLVLADPVPTFAMSLAADKAQMNVTDNVAFTIQTSPPMVGVNCDLRVFNTQLNNIPLGLNLVTGVNGTVTHQMQGSAFATGQNRITAFNKAGTQESAEIILVVNSLPGVEQKIVVTRKSDGTVVNDTSNEVGVNSVITITLIGFPPNLTTGAGLYDNDTFVQNVPTASDGTGVVDYQLTTLGVHAIGIKDITGATPRDFIQIVSVVEGGGDTCPPGYHKDAAGNCVPDTTGGGIGKTWGQMTFTEKVWAVALGTTIGVGAWQVLGVSRAVNDNWKAAKHRPYKKVKVSKPALRRFLRRYVT